MHPTRILASLALCASSIVGGCATSPWIDAKHLDDQLSEGSVFLPAPVHLQRGDTDCGLASAASLLEFHGCSPELPKEWPADEEVSAAQVRDLCRTRGLSAVVIAGEFSEAEPRGLLAILGRGVPALVQIAPRSEAPESRHFALVVGFEPVRRWILIVDPARGYGALPYDAFEEHWARAGHLALIAWRPASTAQVPPR